MKWLIIENSKALGQALCHLLIPYGVYGLITDSYEKAIEIWQNSNNITGAIIDIDNQEIKGSELIKELKSLERTSNPIFIAHTASSDENLQVKIHELGFVGYITKPFEINKISNSLKNILEKINIDGNEKRKHIRVCPDPDDIMRVFFKILHNGPLLSGKIINISMGGVAIELLQPLKRAGLLKVGLTLYKLEIIIDSHSLQIPSIITLSKGKFLTLKFNYLNFQNKRLLARYIYKRISMEQKTSKAVHP